MQLMNKNSNDEGSHQSDPRVERNNQWKNEFVRLGGFTHLLHVLANLHLDQIECALELVCLRTLLESIFRLMLSHQLKPKSQMTSEKPASSILEQ